MRSPIWIQYKTVLYLRLLGSLLADKISINYNCHKVNDNILINFESASPRVGDWIGIFWDDAIETENIDNPLMWMWTCGSQSCNETINRDTVVFGTGQEESHLLTWPLTTGNYIAVLGRNITREVLATSEPFSVLESCPPTQIPSQNLPTSAPPYKLPFEDMHPSISINQGCHQENDNILIEFENNNPLVGDWVGIFWHGTTNTDDLNNPLMWMWTCGSHSCQDIIEKDRIIFGSGKEIDHLLKWPLIAGDYVAILIHDALSKNVLAISDPFSIVDVCSTSQIPSQISPIASFVEPSSIPSRSPSFHLSLFPSLSPSLQFSNSPTRSSIPSSRPSSFPSIRLSFSPTESSLSLPAPYLSSSIDQNFNSIRSDSISTDNSCYQVNSPIYISFESSIPKLDNWIGIYPSNYDFSALNLAPSSWQWSCGEVICHEKGIKSGSVVFSSEQLNIHGTQGFPLEKSSYTAVLGMRDGVKPVIVAQTDSFEVADECFAIPSDDIVPSEIDRVNQIIIDRAIQSGEELNAYRLNAMETLLQFKVSVLGVMDDEEILQTYALLCIYFATNSVETEITNDIFGIGPPPSWKISHLWTSSEFPPCSGWYGIFCNDDRRVTGIKLYKNGLTGSFPKEVTLISSLKSLDIAKNNIWNKGDEENRWLGDLGDIECLYIGKTYFEYKGIPTEINQLSSLKIFDASYANFSGPLRNETFQDLNNLEFLSLSGNQFNSHIPKAISHLPKLQYLYLMNTSINDNMNFALTMPAIREIFLDNNQGLIGTLPTELWLLQTLESLSLSGCGLTGTIPPEFGFLNSTAFDHLWLYNNKLSGTIPEELGNLDNLKIFQVEANNISGDVPESYA
eukprot:CAMPEP_0194139834 /NCGR_PEP_ID=MMETSP0152-20130528/9434_1 /TAXON_ID=1049557 /ORGANISM="Thalassiothrix antarctica, Strain L6-D1" /LENGTH=849 /DNA_ID=CAMNT_0038837811 /DNA_START=107 /DNA_END=2657 /DNA_ORIENTATION=+